MENNLDSIIKGLKATISLNKINVDDNVLFEQAIKLFISNNIQNSKEVNEENTNEPTEKQKDFLNKNHVNSEMFTRKEATEKIKEIINKEKSGDGRKYNNFKR
jgi:hypothetical protein